MKKQFLYYLLPSVSKVLTGFFLIPFTTYYLDPIDFGIVAILSVISGLISPLSSTGSTWVLTAHFYTVESHQKKVLVFNLLFLDILLKFFWCILFFATAAFYLPVIVSEYRPEYLGYYQLALLGILFSGPWNTVSYTLVLQTRARTHAALEVGQHLTNVIVIIVCLKYLGLGVVSLFLAPLAAGTYVFLVGFWVLRHNIAIRLSMSWLKEIFRIGIPSIPFNFFEIIANTIDRFFIQRWSNLANLGIYSHSRTYQYMFSLGKKAFTRSFAPELLDTYAKMKDTERVRQILTLWYGLLGLCGVFVVLFSREIISVLTHGKFVAAAPLVPIWFLLTISQTFGIPYSQYLFFKRQTSFVVKSGILINAAFIGINALAIYQFGVFGAASTVVLSNITISVVRRIYAIKAGGTKMAEDKCVIVFFSLIILYCIVQAVHLNVYSKVIAFVAISLVILYEFKLLVELKKTPLANLWGKTP